MLFFDENSSKNTKVELIKSFVHIAQLEFFGKPAENMQARCVHKYRRVFGLIHNILQSESYTFTFPL